MSEGADIGRLRRRADFLAAAQARRASRPGVTLQGRARGDDGPARVGFTCSKKIGNSVMRNRAKRRLRALARLVLWPMAERGWDYVLIGRPEVTVTESFASLEAQLREALIRLHRP